MFQKNSKSALFYVHGQGILQSEKKLWTPEKGNPYMVVYVGDVKCTAYGRAISDFDSHNPGDLVFIQGELRIDRSGCCVQIARYKWGADLFGEFVDASGPIDPMILERMKPKRFQADEVLVVSPRRD